MIISSWSEVIYYLEKKNYTIQYTKSNFPKIIHQSWKTSIVPEKWTSSKEKWIEFHPDYLYILWTDDMNFNLVQTYYPDYLEQFLNYPYGIQRADFSRICYLYRYGGLYSDLDIAPTRNCTSLLEYSNNTSDVNFNNIMNEESCSIPKEVGLILDAGEFNPYIEDYSCNTGSAIHRSIGAIAKRCARYTNMFMISKPKSIFWEQVLLESRNQNVPKMYSTRHFRIIWTTGPLLIDRVAKKICNQQGF